MQNVIDVYSDMTLKEIAEEFGKTPQAVSNGVARMLERNPEHQDWKYKKGNRVMITGAGVEWLSTYFIQEIEVIDEEKRVMAAEIKRLTELLELQKEHNQDLKESFDKALSSMQGQLLLENNKTKQLEDKNQELEKEVNSYQKTIFGLYKKKKDNS